MLSSATQACTTQEISPEAIKSCTAKLHAEVEGIKRYDGPGNLIMSYKSLGVDAEARWIEKNGVPWTALNDVIKVWTKKNNNEAGEWKREHESGLKKALKIDSLKQFTHKFEGIGQKTTPIIRMDQVMDVILMLPGPLAESFKDNLIKTGLRTMAGDQRMHDVINANAINQSDVHVMTRAATPTSAMEKVTMTPEILVNIYAELARTQERDENGNLIMSLDAIGLSHKIRYVIQDNAEPVLSRIDIVIAGTGKNSNDAAQWIRNNETELEQRLSRLSNPLLNIQFKGKGQKPMPVVTFDQAITILTMLPGPTAKAIRDQIHKMGRRVLAGDQRMHDVIDANAASTSDIHVMARAATLAETVKEGLDAPTAVKQVTGVDLENMQTTLIKMQEAGNAQIMKMQVEVQNQMMKNQKDHQNELMKSHEDFKIEMMQKQEAYKVELMGQFKKSDASKRRQELYDQRAKEKRMEKERKHIAEVEVNKRQKLDEMDQKQKQKLDEMELTKQEKEIELQHKRLAVTKQFEEIEERRLERERIRKEMEAQPPMQTRIVNPAPTPAPIKHYNVEAVARYYDLFNGIDSMMQKIRIASDAKKKLTGERYNLTPIGFVADNNGNNRNPHFSSTHVRFMKTAIEESKREALESNIGYN